MKDIKNKEWRMALIAKYLEAETTPNEEALLATYYMEHEADEDERAVAELIRLERVDADLLSAEGVEEFDRIAAEAKASAQPRKIGEPVNSKTHHLTNSRTLWFGGMAATIALLLALNLDAMRKADPSAAFDTIEIAEHIQQMINLNMEDVTSISASPIQECVLLTATLADGSTKTFVMSKDPDEGSTSMLAIN